jgi:hypothetical protein
MMELESMAVEMPEVVGHPNRTMFRGVLTVVDVPSTRAPSGSNGRRVVLTKKAAEQALPSLMGMALDYAPSYDRHDARRKVGVITQAEVVGKNLEISGFLYARDFPDVVEEIAESGKSGMRLKKPAVRGAELQAVGETGGSWLRALAMTTSWRSSVSTAVLRIRKLAMEEQETRVGSVVAQASTAVRRELGMSYEVADVEIVDRRARVWTLKKVTFTGAAVLRRDKAAYPDTWIGLG